MIKDNRAFSLIEVLVSSLIIVALFGAFYAFFGNMRNMIAAQQNKSHALSFTQNELERLMGMAYTSSELDNGPHNTNTLPDTIAGEDCRLKNVLNGTRTYNVVDNTDGSYKLVEVSIDWQYRGKNKTFSLSTIIAK